MSIKKIVGQILRSSTLAAKLDNHWLRSAALVHSDTILKLHVDLNSKIPTYLNTYNRNYSNLLFEKRLDAEWNKETVA